MSPGIIGGSARLAALPSAALTTATPSVSAGIPSFLAVAGVICCTMMLALMLRLSTGWMALVRFPLFGRPVEPTEPVFWFVMQIAMAAGIIVTSVAVALSL